MVVVLREECSRKREQRVQELGGEGPCNLFRDLYVAGFDWNEGDSGRSVMGPEGSAGARAHKALDKGLHSEGTRVKGPRSEGISLAAMCTWWWW